MEKNYSPKIKKLLQDIKAVLTKVNQEQAQKRKGIKKAEYIVHGTHVDEQTFKDIYAKKHPEAKLGDAEMMLPAFPKSKICNRNLLITIEKITLKQLAKRLMKF